MNKKNILYVFISGRKEKLSLSDKDYAKEFFYGYQYFKNTEHNVDIVEFKETITITNNFNFDDVYFKTNIIYESEPLKLRKIKFREDDRNIEIGFFDHKNFEEKKTRFFALINPYILN